MRAGLLLTRIVKDCLFSVLCCSFLGHFWQYWLPYACAHTCLLPTMLFSLYCNCIVQHHLERTMAKYVGLFRVVSFRVVDAETRWCKKKECREGGNELNRGKKTGIFAEKVQDRSAVTGIRVILLSPSTPIHPLRWCMKIHLCYKPGAKTTRGVKGREKDPKKRTEWRINGFTLAVSSQNQSGEDEEFYFSAGGIWNSQRLSHLLVNY